MFMTYHSKYVECEKRQHPILRREGYLFESVFVIMCFTKLLQNVDNHSADMAQKVDNHSADMAEKVDNHSADAKQNGDNSSANAEQNADNGLADVAQKVDKHSANVEQNDGNDPADVAQNGDDGSKDEKVGTEVAGEVADTFQEQATSPQSEDVEPGW